MVATASFPFGSLLSVKLCGLFQTGLLGWAAWFTALRTVIAKGEFYLAVHFHPGENHSLGGRIKVSGI